MGLDASTEARAAEMLEDMSDQQLDRHLPAVIVVEASIQIPVTLPRDTRKFFMDAQVGGWVN